MFRAEELVGRVLQRMNKAHDSVLCSAGPMQEGLFDYLGSLCMKLGDLASNKYII